MNKESFAKVPCFMLSLVACVALFSSTCFAALVPPGEHPLDKKAEEVDIDSMSTADVVDFMIL